MRSRDTAPLHRRFDERRSLDMATNRYRTIKMRIPAQVRLLQDSSAFRAQCSAYYGEGRPDWSILVSVHSVALAFAARQLDLSPTAFGDPGNLAKLEALLEKDPAPAYLFTDEQMRRTFATQPANILEQWGFEFRSRDFRPETLEWFLKKRMPVFATDPPHAPLFGDPPGEWPEL